MGDLIIINLTQDIQGVQSTAIRYGHMAALIKYYCQHIFEGPLSILEIGSWVGASAITWGNSIKNLSPDGGTLFCIDPWSSLGIPNEIISSDGTKMRETCEKYDIFNIFQQNISAANLNDIIIPVKGKSEDILPKLPNCSFDIVYIDGDHSPKPVLLDIILSQEKIKDKGIICGDDLEMQAYEVDQEEMYVGALSKVDYLKDSASGRAYHPGVTLGVSKIFDSVSVMDGFWFMQKVSEKWVKFEFPGASAPPEYISKHLNT